MEPLIGKCKPFVWLIDWEDEECDNLINAVRSEHF